MDIDPQGMFVDHIDHQSGASDRFIIGTICPRRKFLGGSFTFCKTFLQKKIIRFNSLLYQAVTTNGGCRYICKRFIKRYIQDPY